MLGRVTGVAGTPRNNQIWDVVRCNGTAIGYTYCHSRRRTLGITVRPDKSVSVRVPLRTPVAEIRDFVIRRAAWVMKVWKKLDDAPPEQRQRYESGALFLLQGKAYRLEIEAGGKYAVDIRDGLLVVTAPEMPTEEKICQLVDGWYRRQAVELFRERAIACHLMMQAEGIPLPPVTIRPMKTRWGSYSYRTRRITLNLALVKAPSACLDYVIIHELCHIKVRHHGPAFWQMVERYAPDHRALSKRLRPCT